MKKWMMIVACIAMMAFMAACSSNTGGNGGGATEGAGGDTTTTQPKENPSNASEQPGNDEQEPVEIVFNNGDWPKPQNQQLPQYEEWKKRFEDQYPHITMNAENFSYDTNTFLPQAESGQLPNLYSTWFTEPKKIIGAGYAADITDAMEEHGFKDALNPVMLDMLTQDGRIYGIPYSGYYMGLWYNMNIFTEAGLLDENGVPIIPETYDELVEIAKTIKEKTGKAGFFFPTKNNQGGWQFMNIAWSYGAEFEEQIDGKWQAVFNSPEAVEALQFVKDLKWKHDVLQDNVLVSNDDMFRMFGTDQVGMAFGTLDWRNKSINDYEMSKDNLSMSAVPAGPKGRVALTGGNIYMFSNNSTPEQIDAGFKWLKTRGFSPDVNPETLQAMEETLASDNELGRVVGPHGLLVWINPERVDAENAIRDKHKNVNLDLFKHYMENEGVTIHPEVPLNAQELYKTMDAVVQAVLTDKNADPQALLDKAVADFQRDYLDKAN